MIKEIGARPGEKLHEVLVSNSEVKDTILFNHDYLVVLPTVEIPELREQYSPVPQ